MDKPSRLAKTIPFIKELAAAFQRKTCPHCGCTFVKRVPDPKGCPTCRFHFIGHRQPIPEGYEDNLEVEEYLAGTRHWYDPREETPLHLLPKKYVPPVYDFLIDGNPLEDRLIEVVVNGQLISYRG